MPDLTTAQLLRAAALIIEHQDAQDERTRLRRKRGDLARKCVEAHDTEDFDPEGMTCWQRSSPDGLFDNDLCEHCEESGSMRKDIQKAGRRVGAARRKMRRLARELREATRV